MVIYEHVKGVISVPVYTDSGEYAGYTNDIAFTENDIIKDSCSITSRTCDDNTFSLGGVRPAELSIKLRLEGDGINAYNLYGAKIILYSCYAEHPKESDWVLRGVFWVTSVNRTRTMYTLRASDALVWLDSGNYTDGKNVMAANGQSPVYKKLSSDLSSIGGRAGAIFGLVNEELFKLGIIPDVKKGISLKEFDEINFATGIFLNNQPNGKQWTILGKDDTNYSSFSTPSEYVKMLAELYAGFAAVSTQENGLQIALVPFGYHNENEGYGTVTISADEIAMDSCDIAGYKLYFQNFCVKTYDETGWSTSLHPAPYMGNITIDLTDNEFIDGRRQQTLLAANGSAENPAYNTFFELNNIAAHLRSLEIRPFQLKCYKTFSNWKTYPKLGMRIHIEEPNGNLKNSILTKIIWKFRGGWEFGCAGKDSRVLSQAAKASLASHAKTESKRYANSLMVNAKRVGTFAKDNLYVANNNANERLSISVFNDFMDAVATSFANAGVDFGFSYLNGIVDLPEYKE